MKNHIEIINGRGGTLSTDNVNGAHHIRVKLIDGTEDSDLPIPGDDTYGLDVDVRRIGRAVQKSAYRGDGPISIIFSPDGLCNLVAITLHLSSTYVVHKGNMTFTLDAVDGGVYDVLINEVNMAKVYDYVWQPLVPLFLVSGDALRIYYSNQSRRTYGLRIFYELI